MLGDRKVAVAIPAYKAERSILGVLRGLPAWIDHVVVVDDGSPDRTADLAGSLGDPRIAVIRHGKNLGVGAAMKTAYRAALELDADIIVKMDADGQMDPAQLPRLLEPLLKDEADYAKGNRFFDLAALRSMPALRRSGNTVLSLLTKAASGYWDIADPTNGYTALRREALSLLNRAALHEGYFFESSMLIELGIVRGVVCDVPIPARYADERSSLSVLKALWSFPPKLILGTLRRLYWRHFFFEMTPTTVFLIFGGMLSLFGLVFGAARWRISVVTRTPQTAGTVLLAALPFLLGFHLIVEAVVLDIRDVPRRPLCRSVK